MKINPKLKVLGQLRILPLFVAMLVMAVSNETDVSAQTQSEVQISGVVLDEYGETFPGAGVVIEGTQNGTVTGMDGRFVIRAVPGSSLVISFLGYNDSIVQVPDKDTDMRIVLTEARQSLDEVVVVAFGTQKKETVTGAIGQLSGDELINSPVTNVSNALIGRIAGMSAIQKTGEAGFEESTIRIRGVGTFGGRATPLILLDDIEISSADLGRDGLQVTAHHHRNRRARNGHLPAPGNPRLRHQRQLRAPDVSQQL